MNVVITGTTSGLGQHLKRFFESHSHHVIGSGLPANICNEPELDLRVLDSIAEYCDYVTAHMGRVDILINNAGVNSIFKFEDLTADRIHEIMAVNFVGPVMLSQRLLPFLADGGRIINVISDAAHRPMRHSLAYNCSKAALDMATKQMARELTKPYKVSVIGVRPGRMCGTAMSYYIDKQVMEMRRWSIDQVTSYFKANSVTGQEADPRYVAKAIYDLSTSALAMTMSGACVDFVG